MNSPDRPSQSDLKIFIEFLIPDDPHAEVRPILGADSKYIVYNKSWRDSGIYWDPDMMNLVEATLSRSVSPRRRPPCGMS
jgi:hypothetical protein